MTLRVEGVFDRPSIHLLRAASAERPAPENLVCFCGEQRPERFDLLGVAALADTADCQVIVMDELGPAEAAAQHFQAAVLAALVPLLTGKRRVTFQTNGGTALETVYVMRGGVVGQVLTPVKPGAMFDGWVSDAACTKPWDVEHDEVRGSMTLYARWR